MQARHTVLWICPLIWALTIAGLAHTTVGEHILQTFETPHPYRASPDGRQQLRHTDIIHTAGASYIAPHFSQFQLSPGDYVLVRSPDSKQRWRYEGKGRHNLGMEPQGFFATHIKGDTAILELWTTSTDGNYGYKINYYGMGYSQTTIAGFWADGYGHGMNLPPPGICIVDDTREASCYRQTEPMVYKRSRALARLLVNGKILCTAWLVGKQGHLLTNQHCIPSQAVLDTVDFEFMAQGHDCQADCSAPLACPGVIEATGGRLLAQDKDLDYALLLPDTSDDQNRQLAEDYGYLQMRAEPAITGERIYLPQYPAGWGKRIALASSYPGDAGFARIHSLALPGCFSGRDQEIGYWADTQNGSSGSPVIAYSDHLVVAMHHCGGPKCDGYRFDSPNLGIPIGEIIDHLGSTLPPSAICHRPTPPHSLIGQAIGDNQVTLSWTGVKEASSYTIYRGIGGNTLERVGNTAKTNYHERGLSSEVPYTYTVTALAYPGSCESQAASAVTVEPTGACHQPPLFEGLQKTEYVTKPKVAIRLSWLRATPYCHDQVGYHVYRGKQPEFQLTPKKRVGQCVTTTQYDDPDVVQGETYYYQVRAHETNQIDGCLGAEDENQQNLKITARRPAPQYLHNDGIENGTLENVVGPKNQGETQGWHLSMRDSPTQNRAWFCADENGKDQSLTTIRALNLPPRQVLVFMHQVAFEPGWDGGVLEYSLDGAIWFDILHGNKGRILEGGYNGQLLPTSRSTLAGREAWTATVFPFRQVRVELNDFAGKPLWLRWRLVCDIARARLGWWLDDICISTGPTN